MRSITLGVLIVLSLIWSTVAAGNELSLREIYEQASPAVGMVMGFMDGNRKASGRTGSIIQSDVLVLTSADVKIDEQTARLSVFLKPPESRESQRAISLVWSAPRSWHIHSRWISPC